MSATASASSQGAARTPATASRTSAGVRSAKAVQPRATMGGTSSGQPRASSQASIPSPNMHQRTDAGTSPTVSVQPHWRADSSARWSRNAACCSSGTTVSPSGTRWSPTSRISSAAPRPRGPNPRAAPTSVWSMDGGNRSSSPDAHTVTWWHPRSPTLRASQSSSTCMSLRTCGSPSISSRSKVEPDLPSLARNGRRPLAPSISSSIDAATGRAVGVRPPAMRPGWQRGTAPATAAPPEPSLRLDAGGQAARR